MRSGFLLLPFLWLGLVAGLAVAPPNVVFIVCDDLNTHVSTSGYPHIRTPAFDRLAAEGMTFRRAYCQYPVCGPSRAAIFSGQHASTTGCYETSTYFHDHPEIRPLQVSFAEAGYEAFGAGKLFHHPAGNIDQRGWTEFFLRS